MTAQLIKPVLTLLAVQSEDASSDVTLWNAPVRLIKAILSKQPEISEAMRSKRRSADWTENPTENATENPIFGAIASTKDSANHLQENLAHWFTTVTTSAQETLNQLTAGSAKSFQDNASQAQHSATNLLQSTQSSIQATIQETIDRTATSTTTFFHNIQTATVDLSVDAATGLGDSVETATAFTLEKVGQALSSMSWLVVKSYLWISSKVSTGAEQAMLESAGAETVLPDPTPIVNSTSEVGGWVLFAEVCGVLVFYAALGWYAFWVWQNLPYKSGDRAIGKPDFNPSRWIWWSKASTETELDPSHPNHQWNWHNLPYAEALKDLMSKAGISSRSSDQ